jgi:hypothetical protein
MAATAWTKPFRSAVLVVEAIRVRALQETIRVGVAQLQDAW